jgi:hypothetical protein
MNTEVDKTQTLSEVDGETTTFTRTDKRNYKSIFTVKNTWIKENPDYETITILEILSKRNIHAAFHSTKGPALVNEVTGLESFFLNGKYLNPENEADKETIERIKHNNQFNKKMEEILA